jgi:hypothetical protein
VTSVHRSIPRVVHLQRHVRGDEQEIESPIVQQWNQFARTMIGQALHAAQKDPGMGPSGEVAVSAVVHADAGLV